MPEKKPTVQVPSLTTSDEPVFIAGLPIPLTPADWRRHCLASFPAFANAADTEDLLQEIIDSVYTLFAGLPTLWYIHDPQLYFDKTRLCYRLLICWYIADLYPTYSSGIISNSGLPITRKKIGPIDLQFNVDAMIATDTNLLASLLSNPFGSKAYMMIKTAVVRLRMYTRQMNWLAPAPCVLIGGVFYKDGQPVTTSSEV